MGVQNLLLAVGVWWGVWGWGSGKMWVCCGARGVRGPGGQLGEGPGVGVPGRRPLAGVVSGVGSAARSAVAVGVSRAWGIGASGAPHFYWRGPMWLASWHGVGKAPSTVKQYDYIRIRIIAGTPATVETLTDQIMDHIEASPVVQRDPLFMPLMTAILAVAAVQRLAYREEGLTPTDEQSRVLVAIAEASMDAGAVSISTPELARTLDMTCDEGCRHARALARLGMIEQM
jgi:hypothetical protein